MANPDPKPRDFGAGLQLPGHFVLGCKANPRLPAGRPLSAKHIDYHMAWLYCSHMSESVPDDSDSVDKALLWEDITDVFLERLDTVGIKILDDGSYNMVLESEPYDRYENTLYVLQLWCLWVGNRGIVSAALNFIDMETGGQYCYSATRTNGSQIILSCSEGVEVDREMVQSVRDDINNAVWNQELSDRCAHNSSFYFE